MKSITEKLIPIYDQIEINWLKSQNYKTMKEFNLETVKKNWKKAQSGELVCTKRGTPVKLLCTEARSDYPLIGLINHETKDELMNWTTEGKYICEDVSSNIDLKLQTKKVRGWVNVYKNADVGKVIGVVWGSKEEAKRMLMNKDSYIRTMYVAWDE
ncbi:MAG: hypothetical protein KGY74_10670 [Candidatus Cloacimonetes bacterium]|nr:hypothetical protein [Candidatus Cloacimonadota bacterium]